MKRELALQAVDTVGGIVGGVITNKKNRDFAREQADIAWDRQLDLYNRMKEDNSPLARRLQLNEAGLGPALLGGMAGSMGGSASGTSAPQGATPMAQNPLESANLGLVLAQIQNIKADTDSKKIDNVNKSEGGVMFKLWTAEEKETIAKEAETWAKEGYTNAQTDLTNIQAEIARVQKVVAEATTKEQIGKAVGEVLILNGQYKNLIENAKKTGAETKTIEVRRDADIAEIWSKVALNDANTVLAETNTKLSEQNRTKLIQDWGIQLARLKMDKDHLEKVDIENAKTALKNQLMQDEKWKAELDFKGTELLVNSLLRGVESVAKIGSNVASLAK